MATQTRNGDLSLKAAMALLIQNQAAFVAQDTRFQAALVAFETRYQEDRAEMREIVRRIEKRLDDIEAVLVRHEATLEKLTEAVRDRIGFKGP